MKVLIAGGYGVFGGRLARLLLRDGHDVVIAGRDLVKARAFAAAHGGTAIRLDVRGDLGSLRRARPDVVVDAAGPYQAYGDDPYRLARQAIAIGAHYFDLADDADFAMGVTELDAEAKAAGVVVLSAASSAPAISAAAARTLSADMDVIDLVDIAILPGNRAPRGLSVMQAIMGAAGTPLRLWRGRTWREAQNWSAPQQYDLGTGERRAGYLIRTPDVEVLPAALGARSVLFRAGMELAVMNHALSVLAWLRKRGVNLASPGFVAIARRLANLLKPFGTDRGGMVVTVRGRQQGVRLARQWTLTASAGEGPFVPTTPIRACLRHLSAMPPGARVCAEDLTIEMISDAQSDLSVKTEITDLPVGSVFERALGDAWPSLPAAVRAGHDAPDLLVLNGEAKVTRGVGAAPAVAAWLFGFPPAAPRVPLAVKMERRGDGEIWTRTFGERGFRSHLSPAGRGRFRERFGPFKFELALSIIDGKIAMSVEKGWFGQVPIPRALLPGGDGVEAVKDGRFTFDVLMRAPVTGALIVRYAGWLTPE